MNGTQTFSDETLMRFVDGELDGATVKAVASAIESDPAIMQRVALFSETRAIAKRELAPLLDEPVPDAVLASVRAMVDGRRSKGATVAPFAPPAAARAAVSRKAHWSLPIAASLAAAVLGAAGGYWIAADHAGPQMSLAGIEAQELDRLLVEAVSGSEIKIDGGRFRAINSFRDKADSFCREYEVDRPGQDTVVAVGCRAGDDWMTRFVVLAAADSGGYAPASSVEALDAYLSAIEAGQPLSLEDEKTALAALSK